MKSFRLIAILMLTGLLLLTFFALIDQTAQAQDPDW